MHQNKCKILIKVDILRFKYNVKYIRTVSCVLHTALRIVYTLQKAHCKKFATNHLRFFLFLLFFAKFPLGPNSFISDICSRVYMCVWEGEESE